VWVSSFFFFFLFFSLCFMIISVKRPGNCSAISWQEQVICREELFCYIMARTSYISMISCLLCIRPTYLVGFS
jgi:hypothetical protein